MKQIFLFICFACLVFTMMAGCSSSQQKMENFVDDCYAENKALPMNQISTLYEGYKKVQDLSAKSELMGNCPKAAKKHLK